MEMHLLIWSDLYLDTPPEIPSQQKIVTLFRITAPTDETNTIHTSHIAGSWVENVRQIVLQLSWELFWHVHGAHFRDDFIPTPYTNQQGVTPFHTLSLAVQMCPDESSKSEMNMS